MLFDSFFPPAGGSEADTASFTTGSGSGSDSVVDVDDAADDVDDFVGMSDFAGNVLLTLVRLDDRKPIERLKLRRVDSSDETFAALSDAVDVDEAVFFGVVFASDVASFAGALVVRRFRNESAILLMTRCALRFIDFSTAFDEPIFFAA